MASPVAHTLAGAIIYLVSRRGNDENLKDLWWLILAANLADFDLIPSLLMGDHSLFHRTFTHSITASLFFAMIVYMACWGRGRRNPAYMAFLMLTAYLSQLLLDWLSLDPGPVSGIPVFWPFSDAHYMADPTVFLNIERNDLFSPAVIAQNTMAVFREIIILAPVTALAWWWRLKKQPT